MTPDRTGTGGAPPGDPGAPSAALAAVQKVARVATWIAGAALVVASLFVAIEVTLRKTISYSFGGVDEVAAYVFAIGVAWSFAFTLLARGNIRVDVLYGALGRGVRTALDLVALLVLLGLFALLFQKALATFATSYAIDAHSNTPLAVRIWIPQALWALGIGFAIVTALVLLVEAVRLARRGAYRELAGLIGVRNTEDDIRDDT